MRVHDLRPGRGSRRPRKRIGRGIGSGHGKTSTKGHKGQLARSGGGKGPAFEGGQTPLHRRLPKFRRFSNEPFRREFALVNVGLLSRFEPGSTVTPELLVEKGIVRDLRDGLKVLGDGEINRPLVVRAHKFSRAAVAKIEAAGGSTEVIGE